MTANPKWAVHRHQLPLPGELIRKLGRDYGITKIDLADAYSQVRFGPESHKHLTLSTHRSVLLQNVHPFGILSAPGYSKRSRMTSLLIFLLLPSFYLQVTQPKLNLFIVLHRRRLDGPELSYIEARTILFEKLKLWLLSKSFPSVGLAKSYSS